MEVTAPQVLLRPMVEADVNAVHALDALVQPAPWSEEFLRDQLANPTTRTLLVAQGADGGELELEERGAEQTRSILGHMGDGAGAQAEPLCRCCGSWW